MADSDGNPYDPTLQPGPQGQSSDASNPATLKSMWDNWTSHPENNAAMISFGLQMMQPRSAGQTFAGHLGEAIGAGAEASSANVATQRQQEQEDIATELKQREEARKERETGYYGMIASKSAGGGASTLNQQMRLQAARNKDFSDWLTGRGSKFVGEDNIFDSVKQQFPNIKTKADLNRPENQAAFDFARRIHARSYAPSPDEAVGGGGGGDDITNQAALQWARANPNDPRAKAVLQKAGAQTTGEE